MDVRVAPKGRVKCKQEIYFNRQQAKKIELRHHRHRIGQVTIVGAEKNKVRLIICTLRLLSRSESWSWRWRFRRGTNKIVVVSISLTRTVISLMNDRLNRLTEDHKRMIRCIRKMQLIVARKRFQVNCFHRLAFVDFSTSATFSKRENHTMCAMSWNNTLMAISTWWWESKNCNASRKITEHWMNRSCWIEMS